MSIVHAVHPVPVRHVPRRARKPRDGFVRGVTPVTLADASPSAFDRVARHGDDFYFAHEGRLWMRLQTRGRVHGAGDLVAWLEAPTGKDFRHDHHGATALDRYFTRTPLLAARDGFPFRGGEVDADDARRTDEALLPSSARSVRDFLDANIRIVAGEVLARCHGLLAYPSGAHRSEGAKIATDPFVNYALLNSPREDYVIARLDRMEELARAVGHVHGYQHFQGSAPRWVEELEPIPSALLADDDIRLIANAMPDRVLRYLEAIQTRVPATEREGLLDRAAPLLRARLQGAVGLVPEDQHADVLALSAALLREMAGIHQRALMADAHWAHGVAGWSYVDPARFLEGFALKRFHEQAPMAEDDAEAMADLGPGGMR